MSAVGVAVVAATFAAALYALSSALQHRTTADVRLPGPAGHRSLFGFASRTFRHPSWLLGTAASIGAVALHAVALHEGALALVQPVMISGVVFALPLRSWLDHEPVARGEVVWAALLATALAGFLILATPASVATRPADQVPAAMVAGGVGVAAAVCLWAGRRARGAKPAALLGAAAGLAFAGSAALIKTTTDIAAHDGVHVLATWPPYALLVVGAAGLLVNQLAFQSGPLRWSLPAISTADPMASLLIGIVVYDERLRGGIGVLSVEAALLAVAVASTIALARGQAPPDVPSAVPGPVQTGRAA
jgi:hypothetical protein